MIIVNIDLKSAISTDRDRHLGTLHICNIGGTKALGDYSIQVFSPKGKLGRQGLVRDYPRESISVLNLVRRALFATGYSK